MATVISLCIRDSWQRLGDRNVAFADHLYTFGMKFTGMQDQTRHRRGCE